MRSVKGGCLQGVIENTFEILGLQTKIIEGLATGGMMKIGAQARKIGTEGGELMVAPCFAKGIGAVIAIQTDGFTPGFDQPMNRGRQEDVAPPAWEQKTRAC